MAFYSCAQEAICGGILSSLSAFIMKDSLSFQMICTVVRPFYLYGRNARLVRQCVYIEERTYRSVYDAVAKASWWRQICGNAMRILGAIWYNTSNYIVFLFYFNWCFVFLFVSWISIQPKRRLTNLNHMICPFCLSLSIDAKIFRV